MSIFGTKKKKEETAARPPSPAVVPQGGTKEGQAIKTDKIAERFALGMTSIGDIIAPSYVEVDFSHILIDKHFYTTLFVVGYPRYVGPNWMNPLITFDHPMFISLYIYPTQSKIVLEDLKRKIGEMEATIEGEVRSGKVVDPTVQVALDDALSLQAEIAKGAERFFQFGLYITIPADTKEELETKTKV